MFITRSFAASSALVLLMGGTAHAALTADQVWQSWKDAAALAGLQVTAATEANSGGVLTLNGVTIAPAGAPMGLTISDMTLTEEGDGSVTIRPGASIAAGGGEAGGMTITHEGLEMTAREGEAGGMIYDYSADKLSAAIASATDGFSMTDTPAQKVTNDVVVNFENLAGTYSDTPGANRTFGLDLTASTLAYDVKTEDPNMQMKTASTSETADVSLGVTFALPATMSLAALAGPGDFGKALQDGLSVSLSTKQGVSTGTVNQEDQIFPYQATIAAQGGEGTFKLDKTAFSVASQGAGLNVDLTTPAMPAPVKVTTGPIVMNLLSPVQAIDAAADYGMVMKIAQLTLNDEVWGMFDPGAALKREPFDLAIDVSGKTRIDWIGMMEASDMGMQPPVPAPETLNITEIALKVAGAAANATGAFTFDNSMGMPMPLGSADVSVTGANALIDGLIATGLVTSDDAMGVRMMMGAFMTPGTEPDSLTSKIEAKEGFQIFVNGQQVQ
ncbi:DUF2125 domain-containing protein [Rhodobacter sp. Har01]|uniref:DUF2125 domain-containing protein n=1 Tax=Rhodobacter sp. Har01 TaxID=2883999 RepID=UPI001D05EFA6|nr:DUF2125 domain-containing protein [Rhodobacter sp. Har01]MCB6179114.1 DUF2125 domain-containing protein [Rhodobacter sp. Har01]